MVVLKHRTNSTYVVYILQKITPTEESHWFTLFAFFF